MSFFGKPYGFHTPGSLLSLMCLNKQRDHPGDGRVRPVVPPRLDQTLKQKTCRCSDRNSRGQPHSYRGRRNQIDHAYPLCPDNGGSSGSDYSTHWWIFHPAAPRAIQRRRTYGLSPDPALWTAVSTFTRPHQRFLLIKLAGLYAIYGFCQGDISTLA